jgi:hypothetical protein
MISSDEVPTGPTATRAHAVRERYGNHGSGPSYAGVAPVQTLSIWTTLPWTTVMISECCIRY